MYLFFSCGIFRWLPPSGRLNCLIGFCSLSPNQALFGRAKGISSSQADQASSAEGINDGDVLM